LEAQVAQPGAIVRTANGGRLTFVFRHFPQIESHPNAELAA
jgi:hypothetical protein